MTPSHRYLEARTSKLRRAPTLPSNCTAPAALDRVSPPHPVPALRTANACDNNADVSRPFHRSPPAKPSLSPTIIARPHSAPPRKAASAASPSTSIARRPHTAPPKIVSASASSGLLSSAEHQKRFRPVSAQTTASVLADRRAFQALRVQPPSHRQAPASAAPADEARAIARRQIVEHTLRNQITQARRRRLAAQSASTGGAPLGLGTGSATREAWRLRRRAPAIEALAAVQTCLHRFSESWESSWQSYDAAAAEANAAAAKAEAVAEAEAEKAAAQARRALRATCRVTMCVSQLSLAASASQLSL